MKVPSAVARSLMAYVVGRGTESKKATIMLTAMGWRPDGNRATQEEIDQARLQWAGSEQEEIPF